MRRFAAIVTIAALAVSALAAQENGTSTPTVTGNWTMTVDAGPHGAMKMELVLEQKDTTVTGTFSSPHGDMRVEGEFAHGRLQLATTAENTDLHITFDARLKDEGILSGYLSSPMGDMKWTAERVKDKP